MFEFSKASRKEKVYLLILALVIVGLGISLGIFINQFRSPEDLSQPTEVPVITIHDVKRKIDNKEDFILCDVRSKDDYDLKHIKGSVSAPYEELESKAQEFSKDKEVIVLADDDSCPYSTYAAKKLLAMGFNKVYDMKAGIIAWAKTGYPLTGTQVNIIKGLEFEVATIDVEQVKEKIDEKDNIVLIDVREPSEFNLGHIKGALLVPIAQLSKNINNLSRDKEIIVYDRKDYRSKLAFQELKKQGFNLVRIMTGGFETWLEKNYPVAK